MTKKIDVFQKFDDTATKRLQVVYLADAGFEPNEITNWCGYAVSTIKTYIKKYTDSLLEQAKNLFLKITKKIKTTLLAGRQLIYLFKFYTSNGEILFSKVGTTTKLPEDRLNQEIRYYRTHGLDVATTEICSVIDCGDIPAEGAESALRAYFIHKYPNTFHKNDRFFGLDIPTRTFNKVATHYLAEGVTA